MASIFVESPMRLPPTIANRFRSAAFSQLVCLLILFSTTLAQPPAPNSKVLLQPNQPINERLNRIEARSYQLRLEAGQFARLVLDQKGGDVAVTVRDPQGQELAQFNRAHDPFGTEMITVVATNSGEHQLEVRLRSKAEGLFRLALTELRTATDQDVGRAETERAASAALREARQPLHIGTTESRQRKLEALQKALPLFVSLGDLSGEAAILIRIGNVYSASGDKRQALEYYTRGLAKYRDGDDLAGAAGAWYDLGSANSSLGDQRKAIESFGQSARLFRELENHAGEASALGRVGLSYRNVGDTQRALDNYEEALATARANNELRAEAEALYHIGVLYVELKEIQRGLDHYHQALRLFRDGDDRANEGAVLNSIGIAHRQAGNFPEALGSFSQSLALFKAIGNQLRQATLLTNIGLVYEAQGQPAKALEYYVQALSLRRAVGDLRRIALALDTLGQAYTAAGEQQKALASYEEALTTWGASGDETGRAHTLSNLGSHYQTAGDTAKAMELYERSLAHWRAVGDLDDEAYTLYLMARAENDRGSLEQARYRIERAIDIVEGLRTHIVNPELRASYFANVQHYFDLYISLLMSRHQEAPGNGFDALALMASERARARSLLDLLQEAKADLKRNADARLLAREQKLLSQINARATQQAQTDDDAEKSDTAKKRGEEINQLSREYEAIQAQIRRANPRYAELTSTQPPSLMDMQRLLDKNTLLLEYKLGNQRSYLWVVSADGLESYELPPRAQVEALARQTYEVLIERNRRFAGETPAQQSKRMDAADMALSENAARLSQVLLKPVAAQLGNKRLVIVADGTLQYLPFAVLPAPDSIHPLVTTNEVVNLPSLSVLAQLRRDKRPSASPGKMVAVFADPVFEADDPRLTSAPAKKARANGPAGQALRDFQDQQNPGAWPRLLASREEARTIAALGPRNTVLNVLDFEASSERAASSEIAQYRILHFATHGILNTARPELSGIVLSLYDRQGNARDGFLRLNQIYGLRLSSDLVVLSACRTALGKEVKGEGLIGLTRGFMYAGAPRVMASLWKVDDEATAELMKLFYRNLFQKQLTASQALRVAQVELQKQPRWHSPYYWGAFALQGDWR